ncbi:MAG: DNA primase [Chloroflexi bacterium]|nr:DNA primase [Chloroflexota bacterium]
MALDKFLVYNALCGQLPGCRAMGVVQEVKERTDIVELVSGYVPLQKSGRNFKALCPFHTEKTPSFIVFPDRQSWHCFGACATGGDVFTFLIKIENIGFSEALRTLAQRAGIPLAPRTPQQTEAEQLKEKMVGINTLAARYFQQMLLQSDEASLAREHLSHRGIDPSSWDKFSLGYALMDWEALLTHLLTLGYPREEILAAGLAVQGESGVHDRFRGRLIFPIRDAEGRTLGFGARSLDGSEPKYLNSPETPVFSKGSVLYGLDLAKGSIREKDQAVIVEGYTDVILAQQRGFSNVVASMGTSLTENQVQSLKRLTRNLMLALDADQAGKAATERGLEVMQAVLRDHMVPVPWGRNLIEHQARLDAEIRIALLPSGKDPADILAESGEAWEEFVASALPIMDYYFQLASSRFDLETARGKSEAARLILPLIWELKSEVAQEHYLHKLSRLLRVDERRLLQEAVGPPAKQAATEERGPLSRFPGFIYGTERHILLLFLEEPSRRKLVDQALTSLGSGPLEAADFGGVEERAMFYLLSEKGSFPDGDAGIENFWQETDPAFYERLQQLLALREQMAPLSDPERATVMGELLLQEGGREATLLQDGELGAIHSGLRLRSLRLQREIESLRFLLEEEPDPLGKQNLLNEVSRRTAILGRLLKSLHSWGVTARGRGQRLSYPLGLASE